MDLKGDSISSSTDQDGTVVKIYIHRCESYQWLKGSSSNFGSCYQNGTKSTCNVPWKDYVLSEVVIASFQRLKKPGQDPATVQKLISLDVLFW